MKEWIRLHQVDADAQGEASLRRCTMNIAEGEILFLLGRRNSGVRLLYEILTGQSEIRRGKLFLMEERYRAVHFGDCPILGVDEHTALTQVLSLKANLRSLSAASENTDRMLSESISENTVLGEDSDFILDVEDSLRDNAPRVLKFMAEKIGFEAPLTMETSRVSARDQLLCWFLIAALRKVKLFCLSCGNLSLGEEDRRALIHAATVLRRLGITTLIMDEQLPAQMGEIDRVVWMKEGRIIKEFYPPWDSFPLMQPREGGITRRIRHLRKCPGGREILTLRVSGWDENPEKGRMPADKDQPDPEEILIREGEILGIYDENWPMGKPLTSYLRDLVENAPISKPDLKEKDLKMIREAAYVPYDSQELLVEDKEIGWNLMLAASRLTGTRFGLVQGHMERFLAREFCRKFGLDPEITIPELTPGQKKLLCLNRISWLHPRLILLESPLSPFEENEREQAVSYIEELAGQGSALILSFRNPEEWDAF